MPSSNRVNTFLSDNINSEEYRAMLESLSILSSVMRGLMLADVPALALMGASAGVLTDAMEFLVMLAQRRSPESEAVAHQAIQQMLVVLDLAARDLRKEIVSPPEDAVKAAEDIASLMGTDTPILH